MAAWKATGERVSGVFSVSKGCCIHSREGCGGLYCLWWQWFGLCDICGGVLLVVVVVLITVAVVMIVVDVLALVVADVEVVVLPYCGYYKAWDCSYCGDCHCGICGLGHGVLWRCWLYVCDGVGSGE